MFYNNKLSKPPMKPIPTAIYGLTLMALVSQPALAVQRQQDFGPTLRVGLDYTLLIDPVGKLVNWGNNFYDQLTNPNVTNSNEPISDNFDGEWLQLAVSGLSEHTLAMDRKGQWWGWGNNQNGQMGLGHTNSPVLKTKVGTAGQWKAIATGRYHTLAISKSGKLFAWGKNAAGQLGTNNKTAFSSPQPVQGLGTSSVWIAVSAGEDFSLALNTNGKIYAWGSNANNKLGLNNTAITEKLTPFLVPTNNSDFVKIAAGKTSSIALKANGTVWTWGNNGNGQLGRTTTAGAPGQVDSRVYRDIAIGGDFCLALEDTGSLWSWGANASGQLGDNSTTKRTSPVQVKMNGAFLNNYFSIGAGENFSIAMHADGSLTSWGKNASGQLGNKTFNQSNMGTVIPHNAALVFIGARQPLTVSGDLATLMIKSDGTLWAMGDNSYGTLGIPFSTIKINRTPVQVRINAKRDNNWIKVFQFGMKSMGIQADGTLWTWGIDHQNDWPPMDIVEAPINLPGMGWIDAGLGFNGQYFALNARGQLFAWGNSEEAMIGSTIDLTSMPKNPIFTDKIWTSVSVGTDHVMGISSDGQLWGWGTTGEAGGALGFGLKNPFAKYPTPQVVRINPQIVDNNWVAVAAGFGCTNAIQADGTLWGWGLNYHSEAALDPGTKGGEIGFPTKVTEGGIAKDDYRILGKGSYYSAGITNQGILKLWGPRNPPEAWGTPENISLYLRQPTAEPSLANIGIRNVSTNGDFMTVLTTTASVFGMGEGRSGMNNRLSWAFFGGQIGAVEYAPSNFLSIAFLAPRL
jgi:alpha-tubulin suppressor-like RCC1 family protein